ncbi:phage portal protein family protein [Sorangium sp. So ce1389]|uniref:phage portal protein family protein n=1 Tax=Sorangium sp. So ce1389 TaxID=3133336 RepID=UPI003F6155F1
MSELPFTPTTVYTPHQILPISSWSVQEIRHTLNEHEEGNPSRSARLAEALGRDEWIEGCLEQRNQGILGLPFALDSAETGNAQAEAVAEEARTWWDAALPEATLEKLLRWDFLLGLAPAQIKWSSSGDRWTPSEVEIWDPGYATWDWTDRVYKMTAQEGQVLLTGGTGQWIVHCSGGYERGWMRGAIRSLAFPWLIRSNTKYRDWPRWSEAYGSPMKLLRVPHGAKDPEIAAFVEKVRKLAREAMILLPQKKEGDVDLNYDLELLQDERSAWEGFERLIKSCDTSIAIRILGQNLTTEVKGGSYAAASVHERILASIIRGVVTSLSTTLRNHLLKPWARFNFGDENLAPFPKWDTSPPANKTEEMQATKTFVEASRADGSPVHVDFKAVAEKHGIPVLEEPAPL